MKALLNWWQKDIEESANQGNISYTELSHFIPKKSGRENKGVKKEESIKQ